jgi:hypothetical protein
MPMPATLTSQTASFQLRAISSAAADTVDDPAYPSSPIAFFRSLRGGRSLVLRTVAGTTPLCSSVRRIAAKSTGRSQDLTLFWFSDIEISQKSSKVLMLDSQRSDEVNEKAECFWSRLSVDCPDKARFQGGKVYLRVETQQLKKRSFETSTSSLRIFETFKI